MKNPTFVLIAALCGAVTASAAEPLHLVQTVPLPAIKGGFDLMAADVAGQRLFVNAEDNGTTEVIDLKAGKLAHTITNMHEPKWVVFRPELNKLYIANGDGKVHVLDSDSYAPRGVIEFKEKANNLRYDAAAAQLFVGVGKTFGAIAVVDAKTSGYVPAKFAVQLSAYAHLALISGYEAPEVGVILQVAEDGSHRAIPVELDHEDFFAALDVYRRAGRINGALRKAAKA